MKHFIFFLGLFLIPSLYGEKIWQTTQGDFSARVIQSTDTLKSFENLKISLELDYPQNYEINTEAIITKLLQNNTASPTPFKLVSTEMKKTNEGTILNYELSPQWEGKFDLSFYAIDFTLSSERNSPPITIISEIFPVQVNFEQTPVPMPLELAPLMNFSTKIPVKIDSQNKRTIASLHLNEIEHNKSLIENSQRLVKMLATLLFAGCLILLIKFNKKSPQISQEQKIATARLKAIRSLEQIEHQNLEGKSPYQTLYTKLSQTIRAYLEDRYQLKAPQKTTQEFFSESNLEKFPPTIPLEELKEFLSFSDQIKFAKRIPREDEFNQAVRTAKSFINKDEA